MRTRADIARNQAEVARIKAETALIEAQTRAVNRAVQEGSPKITNELATQPTAWAAAVDQSVAALMKRYPDFYRYEQEEVRMAGIIRPGEATMEQYLEILYLAAKLSQFSASPVSRSDIASQLAFGDATRDLPDPVYKNMGH